MKRRLDHQDVPSRSEPPPKRTHQARCRLLELPRELRDEIYSWVFCTTRFTYYQIQMYRGRKNMRPTAGRIRRHSLTLLETCKQINLELKPFWIENALFDFEDQESFLNKLTSWPVEKVACIRHIRVISHPVELERNEDELTFGLAVALKLVPHLQLKTLTVLGGYELPSTDFAGELDCKSLTELIVLGTGWQELHYLTPNSSMLCLPYRPDFGFKVSKVRGAQPKLWRELLLQRDGADSRASIDVYCADMAVPGIIMFPRHRVDYEQSQAHYLREARNRSKPERLTQEMFDMQLEVLVIVKRGRGAKIQYDRGNTLSSRREKRAITGRRLWENLRKEQFIREAPPPGSREAAQGYDGEDGEEDQSISDEDCDFPSDIASVGSASPAWPDNTRQVDIVYGRAPRSPPEGMHDEEVRPDDAVSCCGSASA